MATVLIVDDSPTQRRVMRQVLEQHGFRTLSASDGREAIDLARNSRPDVIFMDVVMPGGNGFQATRELSRGQETAGIPVVILTSKGEASDRVWGIRQGAVDYLVKPITGKALVAKAREWIR